MEHLPVIILGIGGGAKDAYYWIKQCNKLPEANGTFFDVIGFVSEDNKAIGTVFADGMKVIASDDSIEKVFVKYEQMGVILPFGFPRVKEKVYERINSYRNILFPTIVHPSVIFDRDAGTLGCGNIIGPGTILASEYRIGNFNYINTNCTLAHDVIVGDFNSINPMATISGNVTIGNGCLIGAGATVLQGLTLENGATLGAGAVLTKNAEHGKTYIGVPAKEMRGR